MVGVEAQTAEDGRSRVTREDPREWEYGPICDRALDALALTRDRLAWLEGRSTSEQLPAGHWLVISPENPFERLAELTNQVQAAVQGLRAALGESRAPVWGCDLIARLFALRRQFLVDTSIECEVDVEASHTPRGQRACEVVYWTLSELLTNVRKHAQSTKVRVSSGSLEGGFVYFRVEDDGIGIRAPIATSGPDRCGFGLWNVEQHLSAVGGSMEIESRRGLRVTIALPRS